jgi:hypothetical protein
LVPEVLQLDQRVAPQLLELLLRVLRQDALAVVSTLVLLAGVVDLDVFGRLVIVDYGGRKPSRRRQGLRGRRRFNGNSRFGFWKSSGRR